MKEQLSMWLTINRTCNMRCKWCYASTTHFSEEQTMSLEFVKNALKFANDVGVTKVIIIGGEPLIHPDIIKIVEECSQYGMRSSIVTNGIRYKDKMFLRKLIDAGLSATSLSLKAINREKYKDATGVDGFDDFMRAIKNIKEFNLSHQLSFTVTEYFDESVEDLISLLEVIGPERLFVDTERPELDINGECFVAGNNIDVLAKKFEEVYLKLRNTKLNFGVGCYMPLCKVDSKIVEMLLKDKKISFGCHLMNGKSIIMEPNGNLIPCNHMCNIPLAQFGTDIITAEDYWKFKRSDEFVELIHRMSLAPDLRCVDCKLWNVCGGSCRLRWMLKDNPLD